MYNVNQVIRMEERRLERIVGRRYEDEVLAPEETIKDEDMGRPLSLTDWAESLKRRMYTKARKVV
jgi:hypothetical protein